MRPVLLVGILLAAFVHLPSAHAAGTCPTYEEYVGDYHLGAGVSTDDGAVMVAALGYYVFSDAPGHEGRLVYVIFAEENNGIPGPQRHDEGCDQTNNGQIESDCFLCVF